MGRAVCGAEAPALRTAKLNFCNRRNRTRPPWVLTKEKGMSDDRTKADKAWGLLAQKCVSVISIT